MGAAGGGLQYQLAKEMVEGRHGGEGLCLPFPVRDTKA